jgi:agmatine deiminase
MKYSLITLLFFFTLSLSAQNFQVHQEPPTSTSVRSMAEWEETGTLIVTWTSFKSILAQIIAEASTECKVLVVCNNETNAISQLQNQHGVTINDNIEFLVAPYNSLWVRDYGPNTIYLDNDELAVVDWVYNRPSRIFDDAMPVKIAEVLDIPIYKTDESPYQMVHTGGNYHTNGDGLAFSSSLVIEENEPLNPYGTEPLTEPEIDEIMNSFMGIDQYIKMDALPYDVINHIDMHFRPLDEETIMVGQYPEGVSDGPTIEANILYVLDNSTTQFGTPWNIVRVPMPPDGGLYPWSNGDYRTYTNSVIVNNKILMPTYEYQYDTTAIRIYEDHMPGYEVVGINCNQIIPSLGALHCITKEVGAPNPLRIVHQKVTDKGPGTTSVPVSATVTHNSGIDAVYLYYRLDNNASFESILMEDQGDNVYSADIVEDFTAVLTEVEYYIEGVAVSGKTRTRPVPAPEGFYSFKVENVNSVDQIKDSYEMQAAFPNPSNGITCIPIQTRFGTKGSLELYDINGKLLRTIYEGDFPAGNSRYYIHASEFTPGSYLLKFSSEYKTEKQTIILK